MALDWELMPATLAEDLSVDVVVAADVVYDSTLFDGLVSILYALLHRRACVAYISCTIRNPATLAQFVGRLDSLFITVDEIRPRIGTLFSYEPLTEVLILRCYHKS